MMKDIQEWSDQEILNEARALRVGYGLKQTLRYDTKRDHTSHSESVAEHLFALHYLAEYFLPIEDPEGKLDKAKIHQMITFHDFGEILHGDVPYHWKTAQHEKQEEEDADKIFSSLPLSLQKTARESWLDYENGDSPEANFVNALDKTEPLFELFDPVSERSLMRTKFTYKDHLNKKLLATEDFPAMKRFVEVVSKDMLSRNIFWEE